MIKAHKYMDCYHHTVDVIELRVYMLQEFRQVISLPFDHGDTIIRQFIFSFYHESISWFY